MLPIPCGAAQVEEAGVGGRRAGVRERSPASFPGGGCRVREALPPERSDSLETDL